jgi:uncharacterized protein YbjT (DUF2867 family)
MPSTILVTAATGNIGRAIVADLTERDAGFRAASRDPEKLDGVADTAAVDFGDPPSISAALDGIEVVFLNCSQHPDLARWQTNVVSAASEAGVRHVVKVSGGSAVTGPDSASWVGRAHAEVEQSLDESGIDHTILRPNYYAQNLLMLAEPIQNGKLPVPLPDQKMSIVDARDVGAVAAAILLEPAPHAGQIYDLTGPESLSFADVAARLSDAVGHDVQHVAPPVEAAVETLKGKGAPEWLQRHFAEIMGIFAADASVGRVDDTVERITGRRPRDIGQFAQDHVNAFTVKAAI